MKPMKKRMLQDHTIQDALAFWQLLRRGRFRPLLAEPTENTIIQLFRYVITGASSFLVDFLLWAPPRKSLSSPPSPAAVWCSPWC